MTGGPRDNLADLSGEIEWRLTGSSKRRLTDSAAGSVPDAETYVLVLFDGLGIAQLDHSRAGAFRDTKAGVLESPFPTTTSVALASLATATDPAVHGLIAYLMYRPENDAVVNTLKWIDLTGSPVEVDHETVLPAPNLWERLRSGGAEPITVQPGGFTGTPLSRILYRGARFEPAYTYEEVVDATVVLASQPGRLIFTYVPPVDVAGHMHGMTSTEFDEAIGIATLVWEQLQEQLPNGVALLGTADHGLIEFDDSDKVIVRDPRLAGVRFAGDARGVHIWGEPEEVELFASIGGGSIVQPEDLFDQVRLPAMGDALVMAPPGKVLLPPGFDKRLRCYHGGLEAAEVEVPLLIG